MGFITRWKFLVAHLNKLLLQMFVFPLKQVGDFFFTSWPHEHPHVGLVTDLMKRRVREAIVESNFFGNPLLCSYKKRKKVWVENLEWVTLSALQIHQRPTESISSVRRGWKWSRSEKKQMVKAFILIVSQCLRTMWCWHTEFTCKEAN